MRGLLGSVILALGIFGCSGDTNLDIAALKLQFVDGERSQTERVAVGRLLLHDIEGKSFVVAQYWTPQQRVVQALARSLIQTQPDRAAQLLENTIFENAGSERTNERRHETDSHSHRNTHATSTTNYPNAIPT